MTNGISPCFVCYEKFEKLTLNEVQNKNFYKLLVKCLKLRNASTEFGKDDVSIPLCECCSEFSLDLLKLQQKIEIMEKHIQEKVEEIIETVIESELARKESSRKIRETKEKEHLIGAPLVDTFRKKVIQACENLNSSNNESVTPKPTLVNLESEADSDDEMPEDVAEKTKLIPMVETSKSTTTPKVSTGNTDDREKDKISKLNTLTLLIENFKQEIQMEDTPTPNSEPIFSPELQSLLDLQVKDEMLVEPGDEEDSFITLNYQQSGDSEDTEGASIVTSSNFTSSFHQPQSVSFEQIKKDPIEEDIPSEDSVNSILRDRLGHCQSIPLDGGVVQNSVDVEFKSRPEVRLNSRGRNIYGPFKTTEDGRTFFEGVEIISLNNSDSMCGVCGEIEKTTKGKTSTLKMRQHILSAHYGLFKCHICAKKCRDNYNLKMHMKSHNAVATHTCGICGKKLVGTVAIRKHRWMHLLQDKESAQSFPEDQNQNSEFAISPMDNLENPTAPQSTIHSSYVFNLQQQQQQDNINNTKEKIPISNSYYNMNFQEPEDENCTNECDATDFRDPLMVQIMQSNDDPLSMDNPLEFENTITMQMGVELEGTDVIPAEEQETEMLPTNNSIWAPENEEDLETTNVVQLIYPNVAQHWNEEKLQEESKEPEEGYNCRVARVEMDGSNIWEPIPVINTKDGNMLFEGVQILTTSTEGLLECGSCGVRTQKSTTRSALRGMKIHIYSNHS